MNNKPPDRPFNDPLMNLLFWAGWEEITNPKYENKNSGAGSPSMDVAGAESNEKINP